MKAREGPWGWMKIRTRSCFDEDSGEVAGVPNYQGPDGIAGATLSRKDRFRKKASQPYNRWFLS